MQYSQVFAIFFNIEVVLDILISYETTILLQIVMRVCVRWVGSLVNAEI